ncbi:hypothetical protein CHO01_28990 [Cellulomonas hominis]|uniref:Uncharacterized protein n=1 Tax=Cellulomonas hominis TaxID=156981 RepID=A0A511FEZ3_9CELL|nr:hypothetical protein [Cellulomonas hominis]MBB5474751.1 hypothetical protein [Cellulomonas hominis]NKY05407.1 hypothetical protein [Cellulomonas hominis]GEL47783.1 hypothetical protein CHO01_28990 [Cellulomonas hominis]
MTTDPTPLPRHAYTHAQGALAADLDSARGDVDLQRELILLVQALAGDALGPVAMSAVVTELYGAVTQGLIEGAISLVHDAQFAIAARRMMAATELR